MFFFPANCFSGLGCSFSKIWHCLEIHLKATETFITDIELSGKLFAVFFPSMIDPTITGHTHHLKAVFCIDFTYGLQSESIRNHLVTIIGICPYCTACITGTLNSFSVLKLIVRSTLAQGLVLLAYSKIVMRLKHFWRSISFTCLRGFSLEAPVLGTISRIWHFGWINGKKNTNKDMSNLRRGHIEFYIWGMWITLA